MKNYIYTLLFLLSVQISVSQVEKPEAGSSDYVVTGDGSLTDLVSLTLKPGVWIKSGSNWSAKIVAAEELTSADDAYTPIVFSNENYVFTRSFQTEMLTFDPATAKEGDVIEQITYFDGLGRPMQQIGIKAAPDKSDIITHIGYDDYGRQDKDWLPYHESSGSKGTYRGDIRSNIQQYYQSNYGTDFPSVALQDINAYSQKEFEASPLNRVLQQAAPGKDWKLGGGNEIEFEYGTNILNEVRLFEATTTVTDGIYIPTLTLNGVYSVGELYKTITKDENHDGLNTKNHTTEEFKDKQGRVVLKRTYADIDNVSTEHDTYYVYDDYGNLTYVLPPKVNLSDNNVSSLELSELCYQYKYDYRNRLVEKKIPGKGWEYIIYDNLDRPVLTQDANLAEQNKWLFTKYDVFGRVVYTGLFTAPSSESITNLRATFKNKGATDNYETKVTTGTGYSNSYYTNNNFPNTSIELHTINYYDNYYFDKAGLSLPATADNISIINYNNTTAHLTKSLATGSKVVVLNETPIKWITSITGYDKKARPIYSASHNSYLETTDVVISSLDFAGKVTKTKTSHNKTNQTEITTEDILAYDHEGRLLKQKQTINNEDQEVIAENTYDNLGQLTRKGVGGKASRSNRLQTVDYTYNIRGWLKGINNENDNNASITLGSEDLFGFQINYNTPTTGTALFNGNISQTLWKTKNTDQALKLYTYQYDALNRIVGGKSSTGKHNLGIYDVSGNLTTPITYDKNGNILSLFRGGHIVGGSTIPDINITSHFGTMDNLVYSYETNSNKLKQVLDTGNDTYGFKDSNIDDQDFWYDANGNMTKDDNKGITNIIYNHLNLPTDVNINDGGSNVGTISYIYDAVGTKLSKTVSPGNTTYYAGNYVYEGSSLKFFNHPEGYVDAENGSYDYVYQYKDHLGNVRLSYQDSNNNGVAETLEIIEENNYYPFGLEHKGYNSNVISENNHFNYVGKELSESLDYNMLEMDWRHYDPAIGRFNSIDKLAEVYQSTTPYHYSKNNPIFFKDPSGLTGEAFASTVVNRKGEVIDHIADGDPNIYLESRSGPIVGQEEEGKEYKKGDKVFNIDLVVDTYFELILKEVETKENIENLLNDLRSAVSTIERLRKKIQRGEELTTFEKLTLQSALNRKHMSSIFINSGFEDFKAIMFLHKEYETQYSFKEHMKATYNSGVNFIFSLIPLNDGVKSIEIPDGSGETLKSKTIDEIKNNIKTSPSNMLYNGVNVHGQKLPLTLMEARSKMKNKN
jgi:RHS repeat-associated protein